MNETDHATRVTRDRLHRANRRIVELVSALVSARNEAIARGGSEAGFARVCGLSLDELHEMIGRYVDYQEALHG